MPFGMVSRGQNTGAVQSPLSMLNDYAQLQGRLLDNQNKTQDLRAYDSLGQTIATSPPEQLYDNLRRNPGLARHPEVITNIANAGLATTNIAKAQQEMTDDASKAWGTSLAQIYNSPNPTQEQWDALVQARADTMADPVARNNFITHSYDIGRSIFAGATSPDQVKQRILGQVTSSVGGWDAIQGGIYGGGVIDLGNGRFAFRPLSGPQGTVLPLQPTGGVGTSPMTPLGAPFGASPAAIAPAQPNALAPAAPADTGPSYAPGQVTVAPLAAPGATPAAAPAPAPAPAPGSAAPAPQPTVPVATSDNKPLYTGNLAGRADADIASRNPTTGEVTYATPGTAEAVKERVNQYSNEDLQNFRAAQQVTGQTAQIRQDFNELQQAGGWDAPGSGLPNRIEIVNRINTLKNLLHISGDTLNPQTASYAELEKMQTTLGFTALNQFFGMGRETLGAMQTALKAVPGVESTFLGGQLVNRMIEVLAQRQVDHYHYLTAYGSANGWNMIRADDDFAREHPITDTINHVLSSEFGLGPKGFTGATPQETDANIGRALQNGYITPQTAINLRRGRPANWQQTETRVPGGVSAPVPPATDYPRP